MQAVIVVAPVFGKYPVIKVYYQKGSTLVGWGWAQDAMFPADVEPHWRTLDDVLRAKSHVVISAGIVEVPDEDTAKALLGKEYSPP
jgi:hypothetical protein